jgi:hypothetical protein
MSGEAAAGENSWPDEEEVNAGANSWSDDENEVPPTPVRVERGGISAPGTVVKEMPGGNTWNAERPAPEPKSGVGALTNWVPGGTKATASVAPAAAPEGTAVPMTPMPPPKEHKSVLSPGGNASGPVSRFNLGSPGSPGENASKGGFRSRKSKSRKFRVKKAKKSRKTKKSRKNQQTRKSRR